MILNRARLSKYLPYIFIFIFSFIQYSNTLRNEYALDDEMVMHHSVYMHQGISGIPEILSKDSYQGFFDKQNASSPLAGGRYRPLSTVTFAIEQDMFSSTNGEEYMKLRKEYDQAKSDRASPEKLETLANEIKVLDDEMQKSTLTLAGVRHFVQVLLFALSMLVFFSFLNNHIFKDEVVPSLICIALFIAHPLHCEVVANVKSRDEILSLLFICLSLDLAFQWNEKKTTVLFGASVGSFLLALLSKEYAVALPVLLITGLYLLKNVSFSKTFNSLTWVFIILGVVFVVLRNAIIHQKKIVFHDEVLNNPYLYASALESFCSRIALMLEYLRLIFFPLNLSADYSYQHLPYSNLSDFRFLISALIYLTLSGLTIYLFLKRSKYAFFLIFIFVFLFMINNLLVPIGATLGERLLYHSSAGVCILITFGIWNLSKKYFDSGKVIAALVIAGVIIVPLTIRTFVRNPDWKNDYTLFLHDVKIVPESALVNGNVGSNIFNKAFKEFNALEKPGKEDSVLFKKQIREAIGYLQTSIRIHPLYINSTYNLGLAWFNLGQVDTAAKYWMKAATLYTGPNPALQIHARSFYNLGLIEGKKKDFSKAVYYLDIASRLDPDDPAIWDDLGGACFMNGKFYAAAQAFQNSLNINPNQPKTQGGKKVADNIVKLQKRLQENQDDKEARKELTEVLEKNGFPELAKKYR